MKRMTSLSSWLMGLPSSSLEQGLKNDLTYFLNTPEERVNLIGNIGAKLNSEKIKNLKQLFPDALSFSDEEIKLVVELEEFIRSSSYPDKSELRFELHHDKKKLYASLWEKLGLEKLPGWMGVKVPIIENTDISSLLRAWKTKPAENLNVEASRGLEILWHHLSQAHAKKPVVHPSGVQPAIQDLPTTTNLGNSPTAEVPLGVDQSPTKTTGLASPGDNLETKQKAVNDYIEYLVTKLNKRNIPQLEKGAKLEVQKDLPPYEQKLMVRYNAMLDLHEKITHSKNAPAPLDEKQVTELLSICQSSKPDWDERDLWQKVLDCFTFGITAVLRNFLSTERVHQGEIGALVSPSKKP